MKAVLLEDIEVRQLVDLLDAEIVHRCENIKKSIKHGTEEYKTKLAKDHTKALQLLIDKLDR